MFVSWRSLTTTNRMGKIIPRSGCSFVPSEGYSAGLNYGPQALNNEPWQAINLGPAGAPCAVQLAEPGTYLLHGRIHFGGNFVAGDMVYFGMYDAEQELELGDTGGIKVPLDDWEWEQEFTRIHTTATGKWCKPGRPWCRREQAKNHRQSHDDPETSAASPCLRNPE